MSGVSQRDRPHAGAGGQDLVIAADFGTSGVKLAAIDRELSLVATATRSYPLSLPGNEGAEQNPEDWWAALEAGVADLRRDVPDLSRRAAALVFCAQMCGVVSVSRSGELLRPAMIWLDKRAGTLSRAMNGGFPSLAGYRLDKLLAWTRIANGAPSHNGMDPPAKMLWLRRNEPEVWDAADKFLDAKDWLVMRATGVRVTTADSANLTWMMDTRPGARAGRPILQGVSAFPSTSFPRSSTARPWRGGCCPTRLRGWG